MNLKAPFPWFGGKSRCAHLIWDRFGDCGNYVEPFFGSGAVLLGRPHAARVETVNDKDCYLANFWRATQWDPESVAEHADWPVNEADLHSRHQWLVKQTGFRDRMMADPDYFDAKIAGRWVWGISQWIGSGWCSQPGWTGRSLPRSPRGIQTARYNQRPNLTTINQMAGGAATVVWHKRPNLRRGGVGVHSGRALVAGRASTSRMGQWKTRPFLTTSGQGVVALANKREAELRPAHQVPNLTSRYTTNQNLLNYMLELQARLRRVRVCCGDWQRVLGPSPTTAIGLTGVFLDPPYLHSTGRDQSIYNHESADIADDVRRWAIAHGHDRKLRIALCGYEGEHKMPRDWTCIPWKANGGYGNQKTAGAGRANAARERIWFSPHCLKCPPGGSKANGRLP